MNRFTIFPNLYRNIRQDGSLQEVIEWSVECQEISLDVLVLSWAMLLQSFTDDEFPVFTLDGEPVRADLSTRTFYNVETESIVQADQGCTAVCTQGPQIRDLQSLQGRFPAWSLSINLNLATGTGTLQSLGILPSFLEEIGLQLKQFIRRQARLSDLHVHMAPAEQPQLSILNPNPRTLPGPQLLHQLVLESGQKSDYAVEFLCPDGRIQNLSYQDLDQFSARLGAHIDRALYHSTGKHSRSAVIPVFIPQSIDLYIAWLAILRAGAAFCPVGVDTPVERIKFILEDVEASVVVTQSLFAESFPADSGMKLIFTDDLHGFSEAVLDKGCTSSRELAYVMYTSGSTGRPKGVGISHHAVTQSLLAQDKLIPRFKRFLQFASPYFDVSVFEVFFTLMRGATVVGSERSAMIRDLPYVMKKMQVDAAELTPTVAGELLRKRNAVPSLKILLTIGEMLTKHVVAEFGASSTFEGVLHGMYGPTETTIHCTVSSNFKADSSVNLIGHPFETVSAFVIPFGHSMEYSGSDLNILPMGQIGELVIGGGQLASGYINRPNENSKAYLDSKLYGRLYRTGDKARILPNGDIECLGRISGGQVKLRGQRVELGEIEHVVSLARNVLNAVAIVANGILVVFVRIDNGGVTVPEIRLNCHKWLPKFMIPREFVPIDKFPVLASGKIDRKALEMEYLQNIESKQSPSTTPYRDLVEEKISEYVIDILKGSIASSQSLSSRGLDSLSGIRLASRLRGIGINMDVGKLLAADSIEGIWSLAKKSLAMISQERTGNGFYAACQKIKNEAFQKLPLAILHSEIAGVEPCAPIQLAMLSESHRNSKAYCNWTELQFQRGLSVPLIKKAFCRVADLNDILRSDFIELGLTDHVYGRLIWKKLKHDVFQETSRFSYGSILHSKSGTLCPLKVQFREENEQIRALIHMHHAIYDGWSLELFLDDLNNALSEQNLAQRSRYSNISAFYMDFSSSQSMQASTYWQSQLHGVIPAPWPKSIDRIGASGGSDVIERMLDISMSRLQDTSQTLNVTRQAFFQAAFAYLLSSYFGISDIVFGTVFSGRTLPVNDIESIIGPCIQVLPTRVNVAEMKSVIDLIRVVHSINRRNLIHGALPLKEIKKASGIDPEDSLFDSLITWQETLQTNQKPVRVFKEINSTDFLEFTLTLQLEPMENSVYAKAVYDKSVLPASQVEMFLEQISYIVSLFIQEQDISIEGIDDRLPLTILSIENPEFEAQANLPELTFGVERMACEDPSRIAVEFLQSYNVESNQGVLESITYHELNARANRLSRCLTEHGAGTGDLVSIVLEKSIDLYVSILAVIKTGAGYVPVAPQTPFNRLRSIMEEAKPRICITNSPIEDKMQGCGVRYIINPEDDKLKSYPETNISHPTGSYGTNIASVIFTSDSTGNPKGVLITYHNLQSNIAVLTDVYPIGDKAKMLQACSQAFDGQSFPTPVPAKGTEHHQN